MGQQGHAAEDYSDHGFLHVNALMHFKSVRTSARRWLFNGAQADGANIICRGWRLPGNPGGDLQKAMGGYRVASLEQHIKLFLKNLNRFNIDNNNKKVKK